MIGKALGQVCVASPLSSAEAMSGRGVYYARRPMHVCSSMWCSLFAFRVPGRLCAIPLSLFVPVARLSGCVTR